MLVSLKAYFLDKRIFKRLLCLVLCVLVLILTLVIQHQEAQAFVPLLALTPAATQALGALLVGAGITFAGVAAIDSAVKFWYSSSGQQMRNDMMNAANSAVNGLMQVTDSLWTSARSWIQSNFSTGTNSRTETIELWNGYPLSRGAARNYLGDSIVIGSDYWWLVKTGEDGIYAYFHIFKNGVRVFTSTQIQHYKNGPLSGPQYYLSVDSSGLIQLFIEYNTGTSTKGAVGCGQQATGYVMPAPSTITYTGQSILSDTNYDWKDEQGKRAVGIPGTGGLESLVGKTYTDVQNKTLETTTEPPPTTGGDTQSYPNTWTGYFKDCATTAGDYTFSGSGTITGTMDYSKNGTWAGEWSYTNTGARVWTGTYTDAQGLTWTGTATEVKVTSTEGSINWEPLKLAGELFTNKFPFSLPWDLKRSFTTLSAEGVQPDFDIVVPDTKLLKGFAFTVDLSMFSDLISVAKALELLAFDIGLLLLTRKLLGGAT